VHLARLAEARLGERRRFVPPSNPLASARYTPDPAYEYGIGYAYYSYPTTAGVPPEPSAGNPFTNYANYNAEQVRSLWLPWNTSVYGVSNDLHNATWSPFLTWFPEYWTCSNATCGTK
jgi:hypothetical protein